MPSKTTFDGTINKGNLIATYKVISSSTAYSTLLLLTKTNVQQAQKKEEKKRAPNVAKRAALDILSVQYLVLREGTRVPSKSFTEYF